MELINGHIWGIPVYGKNGGLVTRSSMSGTWNGDKICVHKERIGKMTKTDINNLKIVLKRRYRKKRNIVLSGDVVHAKSELAKQKKKKIEYPAEEYERKKNYIDYDIDKFKKKIDNIIKNNKLNIFMYFNKDNKALLCAYGNQRVIDDISYSIKDTRKHRMKFPFVLITLAFMDKSGSNIVMSASDLTIDNEKGFYFANQIIEKNIDNSQEKLKEVRSEFVRNSKEKENEKKIKEEKRIAKEREKKIKEEAGIITRTTVIGTPLKIEKHEEYKPNKCEIELLKEMPYKYYLMSHHWKIISKKIKNDRGNKCQLCGNKNKLHVHHNSYDNIGNEDPCDLVVLCSECHSKFHDKK